MTEELDPIYQMEGLKHLPVIRITATSSRENFQKSTLFKFLTPESLGLFIQRVLALNMSVDVELVD